ENKKMLLHAREMDLVSFVKDIAEAFYRLSVSRHINFTVESALKELKVYFDADKLDKVLFNLLSNAFKFTQDGGNIQLRVELSENYDQVFIIVEDDGNGMTVEHVNHAFDRFYTGTAHGNLSTGLGLSLSKEFIKLHKGDIVVVSEKWKGTKFIISLPLGKEHLLPNEILTEVDDRVLNSIAETVEIPSSVYIESFELEE